jgi:hypothetical protein
MLYPLKNAPNKKALVKNSQRLLHLVGDDGFEPTTLPAREPGGSVPTELSAFFYNEQKRLPVHGKPFVGDDGFEPTTLPTREPGCSVPTELSAFFSTMNKKGFPFMGTFCGR